MSFLVTSHIAIKVQVLILIEKYLTYLVENANKQYKTII